MIYDSWFASQFMVYEIMIHDSWFMVFDYEFKIVDSDDLW